MAQRWRSGDAASGSCGSARHECVIAFSLRTFLLVLDKNKQSQSFYSAAALNRRRFAKKKSLIFSFNALRKGFSRLILALVTVKQMLKVIKKFKDVEETLRASL